MTSIINPQNKKYAILIGINYYNTSSQLNGCINDANHIKTFLIEKCNYLPENILMLVDDGTGLIPTKQNIINTFNTLINKAMNEQFTELWWSYSGHGSYITDANKDETDGRDEVICPVDYATSGMITDDYIYQNLVVKLPKSVTLFSLMDCCHSGTIFDLPFIYNKTMTTNNQNNSHVASVISISGCRDDQTSADASINNSYEGAMTWSFLNTLNNAKYDIKTIDLVNNMRVLLSGQYTQIPLLAVSSIIEVDRKFIQLISPESVTKPINFKITTDYWFKESSWNVWSINESKYVYEKDNIFTSKYQTVLMTKYLPLGQYKLCIKDTYGDGGVSSIVTNGLITLVSGKMYSGQLVEYMFTVNI